MINTNITNFRKNIFSILEVTVKFNEPIIISTKDGNAVLLSEDDYKNLIETVYMHEKEALKKEIENGLETDINECIKEDEVKW